MTWDDLKRVGDAPSSGTVLAYTRRAVIFKDYSQIEDVMSYINGGEILEMHLFDDEKEYRCIASESRRFNNSKENDSNSVETNGMEGVLEHISSFSENPEAGTAYSVFAEVVQLEDKYIGEVNCPAITVLNKVSYDQYGLGYISDFRLKIGG